MRKLTIIAAALLFLGFFTFPISLSSQTRTTLRRTALLRMDVLSRAALFEKVIADAALQEGVDPRILWTIAYNETRFRPWLTSPRRAQGLMQFIPSTAARFGLADPYEPNASIHAAARYVKHLGRLFNWRLESVLAAYNAGEGTVLAYLEGRTIRAQGKLINPSGRRTSGGVPPYKETIDYVANGRRIYHWLETQGKFPGVKNRLTLDAAKQTSVSEKEPLETKNRSETSTIIVLYDPRTGMRSVVNGQGKLELIVNNGPVIVSPQVRSLPAQKARSTFAGIPP
jgi:hypothetical protein